MTTALVGILATAALLVLAVVAFMIVQVYPYFRKLDPARLPAWHPFKSEQAKALYLERYEESSQQWPVEFEQRMVGTSYGSTFVRVFGPEGAPPLVLLPGGGSSSLIWAPMARALAAHFRTYAIDNLGDIGRSVASRAIRTADDVADSLDALLTALGLTDSIRLMGLSYGGWQSAEYAIRHGDRLHKVVLVAPAATLFELPPDFAWRGLLLLMPHRHFTESMMRWSLPDLAARSDPASRRQFDTLVGDAYLGVRCFDLRMAAKPRVFTDAELARLEDKTLFMVGAHERLYPANDAVARFKTAAPNIRTEMIPDAGHDLLWIQTAVVADKLVGFLRD